jgi:hypothetical protein
VERRKYQTLQQTNKEDFIWAFIIHFRAQSVVQKPKETHEVV